MALDRESEVEVSCVVVSMGSGRASSSAKVRITEIDVEGCVAVSFEDKLLEEATKASPSAASAVPIYPKYQYRRSSHPPWRGEPMLLKSKSVETPQAKKRNQNEALQDNRQTVSARRIHPNQRRPKTRAVEHSSTRCAARDPTEWRVIRQQKTERKKKGNT